GVADLLELLPLFARHIGVDLEVRELVSNGKHCFDFSFVQLWTSSNATANKKLFLPAADDHLVIADFVSAQPFDVADLHLVPRDVVDAPALLVDEVMMRLDPRIEHHAVI